MSLTQLHTVLARPIAHRGLHDRAAGRVENSLEAADAALAAGYGIECDVRLTRDGEAVVFHDETLDRLTSASGRVDAWNSAALAELVLRDGGAIPTLARFLDRVDGRVPLVVEIKSGGDGAAALVSRVTALVAGYGGAIALKSFDATIVALCREFKATCPLGLVGPGPDGDLPTLPTSLDFLSWNVAQLDQLRDRAPETPLMAWTVRSRENAERAARWRAQIVFEHFTPEAPPSS